MRYNKFKWGRYASEVIFWYIHWFGERSKDCLEVRELIYDYDMSISQFDNYRWSMKHPPSLYRNLRGHLIFRIEFSWNLYENYINVKGKWYYLYQAIHQDGATLNFYLSHGRNKTLTHRFLKGFLSYYDFHHQNESFYFNEHMPNKKNKTSLNKDGGITNNALTLFGIDKFNPKEYSQ